MTKFKTIRGMNDVTPSEVSVWQFVEASIRSIFASYAYDEIRFPIVEQTELFSRSVGESTDIVSKEMYTFEDRNGDGIALRPEGTAGCVRACLENDLLRVDSPRLWYMGPMFRYERPQKGRSRQFHQASAEVFGIDNHNVDAELMMMATNLWDVLGIKNQVNLEINSIGNSDTRKKYKSLLQEFFQSFKRTCLNLRKKWNSKDALEGWIDEEVNNAKLAASSIYLLKVPYFTELWGQADGDPKTYLELVKKL